MKHATVIVSVYVQDQYQDLLPHVGDIIKDHLDGSEIHVMWISVLSSHG